MSTNPESKLIFRSRSLSSTQVVLRKTYLLLACTLLFSAITAGVAMITHAPLVNPWLLLLVYFGLLFLTSALRDHPIGGLVAIFALTGFLGYTVGPVIDAYLTMLPNGNQVVMASLGGTAIIFLTLSIYALQSKRDFSYLGGLLYVAAMVAFLAGIASIVFQLPLLNVIVSAAFILIASGLILFQTSQILNGGETNYIMATITLYISILNLFLSLLRIIGLFSNRN